MGFSLDEICVSFLQKNRMYAVLLTKIAKVPLKGLGTCGVGFNKFGKITLYYDPDFLENLPLEEAKAVIEHECMHIVYRHLSRFQLQGTRDNNGDMKATAKEQYINKINNMGCDVAINQYIDNLPTFKQNHEAVKSGLKKVGEKMGLYPETFQFPKDLPAEFYVAELRKKFPQEQSPQPQQQPQQGKGQGQGQPQQGQGQGQPQQGKGKGKSLDDFSTIDSHDLWDKVVETDENGEITITDAKDHPEVDVEYECDRVITKTLAECKNYGDVPAHILREIERFKAKKKHDWKKTLKVFVNTVLTCTRRLSQKRVDRRLSVLVDYLAPGKKKSRKPKILYVRDTSGSMFDDRVQKDITNELLQLAKRCDVFVADCDTKVHQTYALRKESDLKQYKGGGGTAFEPAFEVAKKLGVDGVIYATDTEGSFPSKKSIGKLANATIWLTFDQDRANIPFGKHVNIKP